MEMQLLHNTNVACRLMPVHFRVIFKIISPVSYIYKFNIVG